MNRKAYLKYVRTVIGRFDHPYLQAAIIGDETDTGMFTGRFGLFLERAEERGIISKREKKVLYKHCGIGGVPKSLREINLPSKKSKGMVTAEKVRQMEATSYGKLTGDPRSWEILEGLYSGSYEWPRDVSEWHPLDLVPSLAGDPNLFRFIMGIEAGSVSELCEFTEGELLLIKYSGPVMLRRLKKKLAHRRFHLYEGGGNPL